MFKKLGNSSMPGLNPPPLQKKTINVRSGLVEIQRNDNGTGIIWRPDCFSSGIKKPGTSPTSRALKEVCAKLECYCRTAFRRMRRCLVPLSFTLTKPLALLLWPSWTRVTTIFAWPAGRPAKRKLPFGGWKAITIGRLSVIIYLLFKKRMDYLLAYVTAILGGNVLFLILKMVIHRVRPISETSLIGVAGWSFPSGHAAMSVIFYGMISYFMMRETESWKLGVLTAVTALFVVFLIGFSRIYLQVHYLSDVVAGYVGGLFWLTICLTGLEVYGKKAKAQVAD